MINDISYRLYIKINQIFQMNLEKANKILKTYIDRIEFQVIGE
jgi:NRPS condensation-like uncharacterized protein